MTIEFISYGSYVTKSQMESAHANMLATSSAYATFVSQIEASGEDVKVIIIDGTKNPNTNFAYPSIYAVTNDSDNLKPNSSTVVISEQFLQETDYITDQSTGAVADLTIERTFAHEIGGHVWQDAMGLTQDETQAVANENNIMNAFGEDARDGYQGSSTFKPPGPVRQYDSGGNVVPMTGTDPNSPPPPVTDLPFPLNLLQEALDYFPLSPLVLDVDHSGTVELSALGDTATYFDLNGDGQAELTAWVTGGDGLLARDLDANGNIDDISELFGTYGGAEDGFASLRLLDSDGDGVITDADDAWEDLVVWVDANMDARTQDGELYTLDTLGIASIALDAALQEGATINDNLITHAASFTTTADEEYGIVDAWFNYNAGMTRNAEEYSFDVRAAFLPTLRGFGQLKDIHIAASIDNGTGDTLMTRLIDLADDINAYASPTDVFDDWDTLENTVDGIMLMWAGVEAVNPTSRGAHVDAQHLEFYEAMTGVPFTQYGQSDPLIEAGAFIEAMYSYVRTYFTGQFLAQVIGTELFTDAPSYSLFDGGMNGDMVLSQDGIDAVEASAISAADPVEVWTRFAQFLGYVKGLSNLTGSEISALDAAVAATNEPSLDDWADVTAAMVVSYGDIVDSPTDWGSFEVYYDNTVNGTASGETLTGSNDVSDDLKGFGGDDTLEGLSGHDRLDGGDGDDTIDSGLGDDFAIGGIGSDIFIYSGGNDTYYDVSGAADEIHVAAASGLTSSDVVSLFATVEGDLIIQFDTGDFITVDEHLYKSGLSNWTFFNNSIEKIVFLSDSSYLDLDESAIALTFKGSAGNDRIRMDSETTTSDYTIYGLGGNDNLRGNGGNDEIYGGSGSDWLDGIDGDDLIDGGTGDDVVRGNEGDDILYGGCSPSAQFGQEVADC